MALSVLLARKLWQLVRDYRAHVPGSRLTARTVGIFGALVIAPLLIVYLFSLEFLNRGIDSWFKVEVKQGLSDALVLSRAALDLRMREYAERTETLAESLAASRAARPAAARSMPSARQPGAGDRAVRPARAHPRREPGERARERCRRSRPPDLMRQMEQRLPYVSLEPQVGGRYIIRTAAPLPRTDAAARGALRGGHLCGAGAAGRALRGRAGHLSAVR